MLQFIEVTKLLSIKAIVMRAQRQIQNNARIDKIKAKRTQRQVIRSHLQNQSKACAVTKSK